MGAARSLENLFLTFANIEDHQTQLSVMDEHALLVCSGCHNQFHRQRSLKNKDAYSHSSGG